MRESLQHQTALQQRKQLDNLKDEFISTVSHELRTPLTSIHGALGLLSSGKAGHVDEKAANLLRIANSNTERLVRLINDILDLERMESGRAPLQIRRLELREVVAQAVETMRSMAEKLGVTLEIVPEPAETPISFDGDPDRIQQVLTNLLSNAIKFSPRGGVGECVRRPPTATTWCCRWWTWGAAFRRTSWRASSTASGRWRLRTRGRRAERDWVWRSAEALWRSTAERSGRSATIRRARGRGRR